MNKFLIAIAIVTLAGCSGMSTSSYGSASSSGYHGAGSNAGSSATGGTTASGSASYDTYRSGGTYGVGVVPPNPLDSTSPGFLPLV